MSTAGKKVWITGAGSGIGKALALEYGRMGYHVALSGRREHKLLEVSQELEQLGAQALTICCDVSQEDEVAEAIATITQEWGELDVVIANAGFALAGRMEQLSSEDWHRQLGVNLIGLTQTVRYALPLLQKTKGRIALISSAMAYVRTTKTGAYAASKAAVTAIGETYSLELLGTGVSCTTIHPGFVESDIRRVNNKGHFDPSTKERREGMATKLSWPAKRSAIVMRKAIDRRRRIFNFTMHAKVVIFLARHFPNLSFWLMSRGEGKRERVIQLNKPK